MTLLASLFALSLPASAALPALGAWDTRPADAEAAPNYNDRAWPAATIPRMGPATGDLGAYSWYRATVNSPADGAYHLRFQGAPGSLRLYVNGVAAPGPSGPSRMVDLKRGRNQLAAFIVHEGGDGAADSMRAFGPVTLSSTPLRRTAVPEWRWTATTSAEEAARLAEDPAGSGWGGWPSSRSGQGTLGDRRRFGIFSTALPDLPGAGREAWFESVDDNATVYLNGRRIGAHTRWDEPFGVSLDEAWRAGATNTLTVVVENTGGQGGIMGPVELRSSAVGQGASAPKEITGWKMRAGLSPLDSGAEWRPFLTVTGRPAYYRTHFALPAGGATPPALRFETGPLGRGFVWLNGQNVGRYPEGQGLSGLTLPSRLLRPGRNTLVVFDENGRMPTGARLVADKAANR